MPLNLDRLVAAATVIVVSAEEAKSLGRDAPSVTYGQIDELKSALDETVKANEALPQPPIGGVTDQGAPSVIDAPAIDPLPPIDAGGSQTPTPNTSGINPPRPVGGFVDLVDVKTQDIKSQRDTIIDAAEKIGQAVAALRVSLGLS